MQPSLKYCIVFVQQVAISVMNVHASATQLLLPDTTSIVIRRLSTQPCEHFCLDLWAIIFSLTFHECAQLWNLFTPSMYDLHSALGCTRLQSPIVPHAHLFCRQDRQTGVIAQHRVLLGTHQFPQQPRPFAYSSRGTFDDNEFNTFQLMMNWFQL